MRHGEIIISKFHSKKLSVSALSKTYLSPVSITTSEFWISWWPFSCTNPPLHLQTQTDKFKHPICSHLRGFWEENDSQMSRRPEIYTTWHEMKAPTLFWDWFWLARLRMVPIMCKISAGSTGEKAFVYLTRSAFIWRHMQVGDGEWTWRTDSKSGPCGDTVRRPPEMDTGGWWQADGQSVQRNDYKILQVNRLRVSFIECTITLGGQGVTF